MSEADQFYRQKAIDRVLAKLRDAYRALDIDLSPEELAGSEQYFRERYLESFPEGWAAKYEQGELIAFINRLLHRQGTHMPDFGFLYEKKV